MANDNDTVEMKLLGRALEQLRTGAGMSQAEAGDALGVSPQAWGKYENGKVPGIFKPETQRRLVAAVGASIADLHRARDQLGERDLGDAPPAERTARVIELNAHADMVQVFGLAAGAGERIAIARGSEIRWVHMHPAQRGYRHVGAVEIVGESMYPRWKPRELAYFVFDLPPPRSEDVIVEMNDGTAMIKEYVGMTPTHLMLKEFYPEERTFDVPRSEVKALHAVVG